MTFPIEIRSLKKRAHLESGPRRELTAEEHRAAFREALPELILGAQLARDKAISYRGFLVGCAVFAWDGDRQQYMVYTAGNFRPEKGVVPPRGAEKRCAERNAIESALNDGVDLIIGIVTVATEKTVGDEESGHQVLHPCDDCLALIGTTPKIKPETIFHGVHDHKTGQPEEIIVITEEKKSVKELSAPKS